MRVIFTFLFFIYISQSFSQVELRNKGTIIVAIICDDGIVMAADSRSCFDATNIQTNKLQCVAYFDSVQKIFKIGNFKIAKAGFATIYGDNISKIISNFNKHINQNTPIDQIFDKYKKYVISKYHISDSEICNELNPYILAGYQSGVPYLLNYKSDTPLIKNHVGGAASNDSNVYKYIQKYVSRNKCSLCGVDFFRNILDSSLHEYYSIKQDIGGPLNVIAIKPDNSFIELETFDFLHINSDKDTWNLINQNKIKMWYINDEIRDIIKHQISDSLKRH